MLTPCIQLQVSALMGPIGFTISVPLHDLHGQPDTAVSPQSIGDGPTLFHYGDKKSPDHRKFQAFLLFDGFNIFQAHF